MVKSAIARESVVRGDRFDQRWAGVSDVADAFVHRPNCNTGIRATNPSAARHLDATRRAAPDHTWLL
jgi:hypothetical protein